MAEKLRISSIIFIIIIPCIWLAVLFSADHLFLTILTTAVTLVSARVPGVPPEQDHYLILLHTEAPNTSSSLIPCMFILSLIFFCFYLYWVFEFVVTMQPLLSSLSSLHSYVGVPSQCF